MIDLSVGPGRYIVAVSGGVDSMALLHVLQQQPGVQLTVAHFDHGIRDDSQQDRLLVQQYAQQARLPFVYERAELGAGASEAVARQARYDFLRKVRAAVRADAILTAHHQDDLLETAVFNVSRGTGRRGLSALHNPSDIVRPLLHITKQELIDYAREQGLTWREDSTNQDLAYTRNYIRHSVLKNFDDQSKQRLLDAVRAIAATNRELDTQLINTLHLQSRAGMLDRAWFASLPFDVAVEVMAAWLRAHGVRDFSRRGLMRLTVSAKVQAAGTSIDVYNNKQIRVTHNYLALAPTER